MKVLIADKISDSGIAKLRGDFEVDVKTGLSEDELDDVASICTEKQLHRGEIITSQGEHGDELFIVTEGFVEIILPESRKEKVVSRPLTPAYSA